MEHLDDGLARRLAAGVAAAEEVALARTHLGTCADCRARVEHAASSSPSNGPTRAGPGTASEAATKVAEVKGPEAWARLPALPDSPPVPLLPRGTMVGRYLLLQPVGHGGMGIVYAAYDPELDRKLALKLLRVSRHPMDDGQARLLREAQAMARVSHPNVTAVYDVGTYGEQVFIAMDLVEGGKTMRDWLLERPRTWREVLEVMLAAGRGLAAAHAAGLVHRDFKPENILVGQDGRVRVTDFGLARPAGSAEITSGFTLPEPELPASPSSAPTPAPESDERTRELNSRLDVQLTQVGAVVGTPSYMAPEQHLGHPPDARSDQFSFCVALYYALFGRRPFEPRQFAEAVKLGKAEGLIHPPPRVPSVPAWVKRAIMRGLSLSSEERFPSVEALLERLSRPPATVRWAWAAGLLAFVTGVGLLAQHEVVQRRSTLCSGAEERLRGVWDSSIEHQVQTAFAATGRPYAAFTFQAAKSALDAHARDWVAMHTEACQATRIRGEQTEAILTLRMTCLERRRKDLEALTAVLVKSDVTVLDRAVEMVRRLPGVSGCADVEALAAPVPPPADPGTRAEVEKVHAQLSRAKALASAGNYPGALEAAGGAVEVARRISYAPLRAETLAEYGWDQMRSGRGKEAEATFYQAWRAAEEGHDDALRVLIASNLVYTYATLLARLDQAQIWGKLGEDALVRLGHSPQLELKLRAKVGMALYQVGKYQDAEQELTRALALCDRENLFDRSDVLSILARLYQAQGKLEEAVKAQAEAVALSDSGRGKAHPQSGLAHNNLAQAYLNLGDAARAAEQAREALRVLEESVGQEHFWVGVTCDTLATALTRQQSLAEAAKYAQRALVIQEKAVGKSHPMLLTTLDNLGYVYLHTGRSQQAVPLFERALALNNPEPGPLADVRFHAAEALVASGGDRKRARELAVLALDVYRSQGQREQAAKVERWLKSP